jgi:hypothetical protein
MELDKVGFLLNQIDHRLKYKDMMLDGEVSFSSFDDVVQIFEFIEPNFNSILTRYIDWNAKPS